MASSCKYPDSKRIIHKIDFTHFEYQQDIWGSLNIILNHNKLKFKDKIIPLYNKDKDQEIGEIILKTIKDKKNLYINLNIDEILKSQLGDKKLPNNLLIPNLPEDMFMVKLQSLFSDTFSYFSFDEDHVVLGVSLPYNKLKYVGKLVGKKNLFIPIKLGKISSQIGIYTSRRSSENGFALFADLTKVLYKSELAHHQSSIKPASRSIFDELN